MPGWHRLTRSGYRWAAGPRSLLAVDNRRRFAESKNCLLVCHFQTERNHFPRLLVADATRVVAALQPGPPLRGLCWSFANRITCFTQEPCNFQLHHVLTSAVSNHARPYGSPLEVVRPVAHVAFTKSRFILPIESGTHRNLTLRPIRA